MDKYLKPIPALEEVSKPFWQGCRREELLLQRCNNCGRFQFYPRPLCINCMSRSLEWVRSSGKGAVYSFTVTHQTTTPGFAQELPYVFAIVELIEGVRLTTNIVGCPPEQVYIGMPVVVVFEPISPEISLPKFVPSSSTFQV